MLSKTTLELPSTKDNVELELAVKVLMRTNEPRLTEKAPASNIVVPFDINAIVKPPLN